MPPAETEHPDAEPLRVNAPVASLPGVGPSRAGAFSRLGIFTLFDLLRHMPTRYELHHGESTVAGLPPEGIASAVGEVVGARYVAGKNRMGGRSQGRFEANLADPPGVPNPANPAGPPARVLLTWFNGGWLRKKIHPGQWLRVSGKVQLFNGYPQIVNPTWELIEPRNDEASHSEERVASDAAKSSSNIAHRTSNIEHGPRLHPIYPATEGLGSSVIEKILHDALPRVLPTLADPLPLDLLASHNMPPLASAYRMVHSPEHEDEAAAGRRRLAFNELLLLQLGIAMRRAHIDRHMQAPALRHNDAIDAQVRGRFPFPLTQSQDEVIREIVADLKQTRPMNRLLQGDVGAGKTVVALYALLLAVADRKQGVMMAPTELLAEQHHASISRLLEGSRVRVDLLTAGVAASGSAARVELEARIASGDSDLIIGTQALLSQNIRFHDLAVAVIDEQHRFGVVQRAAFRGTAEEDEKVPPLPLSGGGREGVAEAEAGSPPLPLSGGGREGVAGAEAEQTTLPQPLPEREGRQPKQRTPHHLVMTATPIPRTLSLTVFGDLDVSTIRGLPPGRTPIATRVVAPDQADDVYSYLRTRLERGEQAYVVVPTIGDAPPTPTPGVPTPPGVPTSVGMSAEADTPMQQPEAPSSTELKNVHDHTLLLQQTYCQGYTVASVHGQLRREERERIMDRFRKGDIHVLVATTVIEVGVDVPNASVMIIEHAERFGLAQLHQLRGRVGRGDRGIRSLCVFITHPTTDNAQQRIAAIAKTSDGFQIAEMDLEIRGMGDFFGTRQHGLPPLRVATIPDDLPLLQLARRDAHRLIDADPTLDAPEHAMLKRVLLREYGEALGLIDVG